MIIGLTGTIGSGKDLIAQYLINKGFEHFSTSDILREINAKKGRPAGREFLNITATEVEKEIGGHYLAELALKRRTKENIVVSAIRRLGEIEYLGNQNEPFALLFIDAPMETRYQRLIDRSREGEENETFEQFKAKQESELSGKSSQRVDICKQEADFIVINDGTKEELFQKIEQILTGIKN